MVMKKYFRIFPSGLFARSILILLFPVVLLQAVMAIIIIDRHFRDVTVEMSGIVGQEITYLMKKGTPQDGPAFFNIDLTPVAQVPAIDAPFLFYDYTGRMSIDVLKKKLPSIVAYDFRLEHEVNLYVRQGDQILKVSFARKKATPFNVHQLLLNMVFFGLILSTIAILYLRNQIRSITRLTTAAEAFGRGQTIPYVPRGASEIRMAGQAFLAMRNRIERFLTQRTLLLASISHDLRTPITRLRLALSMQETTPENTQMVQDVVHMEKLLNEVLEFGKGVVTGQLESIDVADLVQKHARLHFEEEVRIKVIGTPRPVRIRSVAMERAFDNVLCNARRFAQNTQITLTYEPTSLTITFEDNGPGVPETQYEELLQPFTRGDSARTSSAKGEGLGLGLAIVQDVIQAHGGTITLGQSATLGGLSVTLWMPR